MWIICPPIEPITTANNIPLVLRAFDLYFASKTRFGDEIVEQCPLARLEPGGMILPSDGGTYPLLGLVLHSNRTTELGSKASFRVSFVESAVIVLWGTKAFSHVLAPLSATGHNPESPYVDLLVDYIGSLSSLSSCCPVSDLRREIVCRTLRVILFVFQ
jgi:hypothetical protein